MQIFKYQSLMILFMYWDTVVKIDEGQWRFVSLVFSHSQATYLDYRKVMYFIMTLSLLMIIYRILTTSNFHTLLKAMKPVFTTPMRILLEACNLSPKGNQISGKSDTPPFPL